VHDRPERRQQPFPDLQSRDAMTMDPAWLLERKQKQFSQSGEEGIIEAILERVGDRCGWCVEFGASDGRHLSNTRQLIVDQGYSAVLIEGDDDKFEQLRATYAQSEQVVALRGRVGFTDIDGLDAFLGKTPIPAEFDFLSIDIDGNDYHAWDATRRYRPKLVCIEFNPTIPNEVLFVQRADMATQHGSSLSALVKLGKAKGYELACVLPPNAFFVTPEVYERLGIADNRPETLRRDNEDITFIFSGYDGTVFLRGRRELPWHRAPLRERRVQHLPRLLRRYPTRYSAPHRALLFLYWLFREPGVVAQKLGRRWKTRKR
jgi:hypothetical protein